MHRIPADQYLPSGRVFTVRGVAEALEFTSLATATMKKEEQAIPIQHCSIQIVRYYIPGEEVSAVATFSVDVSDVVTPVKQKKN